MRYYLILLSLSLLLACDKKEQVAMIAIPVTPTTPIDTTTPLTYLALGDSYTIGEAVKAEESFPYQLVSQLKNVGLNFAAPKIIAKTGWTTDELQLAIKEAHLTQTYDVVTLLIGVNNQYRGYSTTTYRKEFAALLQTAITFAKQGKSSVFVVSIPDWGVTPFGKNSGKDIKLISKEIDAFNAINKEESLAMGVSYVDITPGSRNASTNLSLIASDGLHPSGKMYTDWASALLPPISLALK